ncbi:hemagglutinin repeat-containing protein [Massilia sp. CCM 9210]|uniref:hemagglutinin repeat-containing protein n=1 Tax=Massilia scottii TaxID=3057166 RepID=UPI00279660C5|nr:hemagglutinin repeat-containing protein [Massilia sp. CCM 9210]MDQ1816067.1 hemagglutinin repeat-containing protein [Massilia sp. CCM 9210]
MKSPIRHLLKSKQSTLTAADRLVQAQLEEPMEAAGRTGRPWTRTVARMMIVLQILQTALIAGPAYAQVVAAGNAPAGQKPLVDAAANGVPIVLIAPPSAAGVSHNRYDQFNVGKQGLILNNSRDTTSTQLGGIVNGNMQLGTTSARIILNEVTSGNPSRLNGYIEVAGQRADLVIANPNGISCDGCGFLNTAGRATLTTGTPQYNSAGQLDSLNVQRGVITIGAGGLNASNVEQLDLLARGIVIEGEISTKNLQAVLGANKVLYGTLKATVQDGTGNAPRFAIDIADLGGMFANQIYLVATEKGLGVNSAGRIASLTENLTLSAQGDLTLKDNYSKKDVDLSSSGKVTLLGQTNAHRDVRIAAAERVAINSTAVLRAEQGVLLNTRHIDNSGSLIQKSASETLVLAAERINSSGSIYSATDLTLQAKSIDGKGGVLQAERALNVTADSIAVDQQQWAANDALTVKAGQIRVSDSVLAAATDLSMNAAGALDVQGSQLTGKKAIDLRGAGVNTGAATVSGASIAVDAGKGKLDNTAGVIYATGNIDVRAVGIDNTRGKIVATDKLALHAGGGALDNTGGTVASKAAVFTGVGSIRNREGTLSTTSDLVLDGAFDNNKGKLITAGALTFTGRSLDNAGGAIQAGQAVKLTASGLIDSAAGIIQSTGSGVTIKADRLDNTKGAIAAATDIGIDAQRLLGRDGEVSAGGKLAVTGATLDLGGASLASNGTLDLAASDIVATAARLQAGQALTLKANNLSAAGASLASVNNVDVAVTGDAWLDKAAIAANGNIDLNSRNLHAQQLRVESGAGVAIKADGVDLRDASLSGARGLTLTAGNLLMQGGSAISGGKLTITGQSQQGGKLSAAGDVDIRMEKRLDLTGGAILAGGDIAVRAEGIVTDKAQVGGKHIVLDAGLESMSNVQGTVVAESGGGTGTPALVVRGNGIDNNRGVLSSDAHAVFDAKSQVFDNNGGNIVVAGDMDLSAGTLKNRFGSVATGSSIVMRGNDVDNTDGQLRSGKDVIIEASGQRLGNDRGLIEAQGAMTLAAAELTNVGGKLAANQTLSLTAGALNNSGGTVAAGKDLTLSVGGVINSANGSLRAGGPVSISTQRLDAAGAQISSQAQIVIAAGQGIDLDKGDIKAGGSVDLSADRVQAGGATIISNGAIAVNGRDSVNLAGADINASGAVAVKAGKGASLQGTQIATNAELQINAANIDAGASRLSSAGDLTLHASTGAIVLDGGHLASGARLQIDGKGIDAANATLAAKSDIALDTRGADYTADGSVHRSEAGGITVKANNIHAGGSAGLAANSGFIAKGAIVLDASGLIDAANSSVSSGSNVVLNAGKGISTAGGAVSAMGSATLSGATIDNAGGAIAANGAVKLVARDGGIDNGGGSILSRDQLTLQTRTGLDRIAGKPVAAGGATDLNNKGGSIVGVGGAVINSGSIDNSGGKIASGDNLVLDLGNSDFKGAKGSVLSEKALTLTAREIDLSGGQLRAGKGVTMSGDAIMAKGTAISAAAGDLLIDSKGSDVDASGSDMLASGQLSLKTGTANLAQANLASGANTSIASAALDARQAKIQAGGDIAIGSSAAINAQDAAIGAGGKLDVTAASLKGGQYSAFKDLTVVTTGGIDLGKSTLPGAQGGAFLTDAALSVKAQGLILDDGRAIGKNVTLDVGNGVLSNRGGTILATDATANAPALKLTSNGIDSTGGSIVSNGDLIINSVSGTLENSKGTIGALRKLDVVAGKLGNAGGSVVANTALAMQVQALDNQAGKIQAGTSLNIKAGDIDNRAGTLVGSTGIELTAGKVDSSAKALIGSNGNITLHTQGLDNSASQVTAGGKLAIDTGTAGAITNVKGRLTSDGGMTLASAGELDNRGGTIAAGEGLDAQILGALLNKAGNIVASKQIGLSVNGPVANQGGAIQAGTDILIGTTKGIDNDAGKLIANGALGINAASLTSKKGLISAGQELTVDVKTLGGALDNQGGQIQASGKASIAAKGLGNVDGIIIANQDLVLDAGKALLDNRGGIVQSAKASVAIDAGDIASQGADSAIVAAGDLTIAGGNIDSSKGLISAGKDLSLVAQGALGNAQGRITAGANATVQGKGIDNSGALLSAGKSMTVQAGSGSLVNSGGSMLAGDSLTLGAASVQNVGGTLASNGDLNLVADNSGTLDNSAGTIRSAQGSVSLTGGQLLNGAIGTGTPAVGGMIAAGKDVTIVANGALGNRDGSIVAANKLSIQAVGALDNNNGKLTGANALAVSANGITSVNGSMLSNGVLTANAGMGAFDNRKGVISGGGTTKLSSVGAFDNTDGKITTGANLLATTGAFDNVRGLVSAQGGASLTTAAFDGRKGEVIGQQSLSINTQGARFDGSGGRFASNGGVTLATGDAVLTGSTIAAGDSFGIDSLGANSRLDADGIKIAVTKNITMTGANVALNGSNLQAGNTISVAGTKVGLNNAALAANTAVNVSGTDVQAAGIDISTQGDISLQSSNTLDYRNGQFAAGNNAAIYGGGLVATSGAKLAAGKRLSFGMGQQAVDFSALDFTYQFGTDLLVQAMGIRTGGVAISGDNLFFDAGTGVLDNTYGTLSATGVIEFKARGMINSGGLIAADNLVSLDSGMGAMINDGGTIASAAGKIGIAGSDLLNKGGNISAADTVNVSTIGLADNAGGNIVADGEVSLYSGTLGNVKGQVVSNKDKVTINVGTFDNNGGVVSAKTALDVTTKLEVSNKGGSLVAGTDATIIGKNGVNNTGGLIGATEKVVLTSSAGILINQDGTIQSDKSTVEIDAAKGIWNQKGDIYGVTSVQAKTDADLLNMQGGRIASQGEVKLGSLKGKLDNADGVISSGTDLIVAAKDVNNAGGVLSGLKSTKVDADSVSNNAGVIESGVGGIAITAKTLTNDHSGTERGIVSHGDIAITGGSVKQNGGYIGADGKLTIDGTSIDNAGGSTMLALKSLSLTGSSGINNQGGNIKSALDTTLKTPVLNNVGGTVFAHNNLLVDAAAIDNSNTNNGAFDKGLLASNTVTVNAATVGNVNGAIVALKNLKVAGTTSIDNSGGQLSGEEVTIDTADFINTSGRTDAMTKLTANMKKFSADGVMASTGTLRLAMDGDFTNGGTVAAENNLEIVLNNGKYTNASNGTISAAKDLSLSATELNNYGTISATNTTLDVGTFNNAGTGVVNSIGTTAVTGGNTFNSGRIYGGNVVMGGAVTNEANATIGARDMLTVNGLLINKPGANVISLGNMKLGSVVNAGARIESGGNLEVGNLRNINCVTGGGGNGVGASDCGNYGLQGGVSLTDVTTVTPVNKVTLTDTQTNLVHDRDDLVMVYADDTFHYRVPGEDHKIENYVQRTYSTKTTVASVIATSNPGMVTAAGVIHAASAQNIDSRIVAGGSVLISGGSEVGNGIEKTVGDSVNISTQGSQQITETGSEFYTSVDHCKPWQSCKHKRSYGGTSNFDDVGPTTSIDVAGVLYDSGGAAPVPLAPADTVITPAEPAKVVGALGTGVAGNLTPSSGNTAAGDAAAPKTGQVATYTTGSTTVGINVGAINADTAVQGVAAQGVIAGGAPSVDTSVAAGGTKIGAQAAGTAGGAGPVSTDAQQQGSGGAADVTVGTSAQPVVKGQVAGNALPGSIIAGNARAAQQTAIGDLTTSFAKFAAARPVTVADKKVDAGVFGPNAKDVNGRATDPNVPNVTLTSNADWKAPTGNLFSLKPGEGAGYLVETDPLFTDKNKWTGSDYFLDQLDLDPQRTLKRYGDGFVEQRAFADQLINITGRNKLSGYENNEQAFKALMDSGVAYAKQFQLTPGVALSEQQMAQLTTDIVWMQEETVTLPDGSTTTALVPKVYLRRPQQGDLSTGGALIAGDNVTIRNQNGGISNSGTILAGYANAKPTDMHGTVTLDAQNVTNRGTVAGNAIDIKAANDIANVGGRINGLSNKGVDGSATDDSRVTLNAGRDILVASTTQTRSVDTVGNNGTSTSSRTNIDRVATIAGGNVFISAKGNFTARAAQVDAAANLTVLAGKNIDIAGVEEKHALFVPLGGSTMGRTGYTNEASVSNVGSNLTAGNNVTIRAAGDVTLSGSQVASANDVSIGGANVTISAVKDRTLVDVQTAGRKEYNRAMNDDESLSGGVVSAGNNVTISATGVATGQKDKDGKAIAQVGTGNLVLNAGTIVAETGVAKLLANNDLTVQAITTEHDSLRESYSKSRTLGGSRMSSSTSTESLQQVTGSRVVGDSVLAEAGKDLTVSGSLIAGVNDVSLKAVAGNVTIKSAEEIYKERNSAVQKQSGFTAGYAGGAASVGYNKSSGSSQSNLDLVSQAGSTIKSTAGKVSVTAGEGIKVAASELNAKTDLTLSGKTVDLLAAQNTSDEHSAYKTASKGFSVGVTLDPKAAFSNARNESEKGNSADSGVGKLTKRADGVGEGLLAAIGGVVLQGSSRSAAGTRDHVSSTAQVSTLKAGGNLSIDATGGSITSEGATLKAEGDAKLTAKDSIILDVAHSTESEGQDNKAKGWSIDSRGSLPVGMFNNKDNGKGSADTISGTTLSVGGNATLKSTDGDIVLTAASVVADKGNVDIAAGRNLTIQSGQDTVSNDNHSNNKAIGKVVVSDTERFAGYNNIKKNGSNDAVTQVQSGVASINGNITLTAGEKYTQTSSNVLAKNDVSVTAKSIEIGTALNTSNSAQDSSDLKIGGFARISSPLIDLANNRKAAKESDGRLSTMQNMAAAANAYQAVAAGIGGSGTLFKAEAGIGIATAKSRDQSSGSVAIGSTLTGTNGNVTLTTTEGDIKATGAGITAGKELKLDSARDIVLQSATSQTSSEGSNNNAGVEVGVGVQVGAQTGTYVYATANVGKGEYDNNATVNTNTKLTGATVNIASKGDTTLKGAVVKGDSITANVGGKLAIESVQDTNKQHNEQTNIGARVQLSFGTAWEASGNIGHTSADGSSKVVLEQSGLFAGDGGYHVKADTIALKGGAIGSTNAANSDLTAKAITFENLDNQMDYKAQSVSLSGGFTTGAVKGAAPETQTSTGARNPNVTPGLPMQDKGKDSSTTYATLTDGKINIGGKEMSSAADLGAHTDLATANKAIDPLKDMKAVAADLKAMGAAGSTVVATSTQIAGDIAKGAAERATQALKDLAAADVGIGRAQAVLNDPNSTAEQRTRATGDLAVATQIRTTATLVADAAKGDAKNWGPKGDYSQALSVVTGVLVGGLSGQSIGQLAANASAPYAATAIGDYFTKPGNENPKLQLLSHALLGGVLAAANGGSVAGGAASGVAGEAAAQAISRELYPQAYDTDGSFHPDRLTAEQSNTVVALATAVGSLVAGATGGSLMDAALGGNIAANAATNNYLSHKQMGDFTSKLKQCNGNPACIKETTALYAKIDASQKSCATPEDCKNAQSQAYGGLYIPNVEVRSLCGSDAACVSFASGLGRNNRDDANYFAQRAVLLSAAVTACKTPGSSDCQKVQQDLGIIGKNRADQAMPIPVTKKGMAAVTELTVASGKALVNLPGDAVNTFIMVGDGYYNIYNFATGNELTPIPKVPAVLKYSTEGEQIGGMLFQVAIAPVTGPATTKIIGGVKDFIATTKGAAGAVELEVVMPKPVPELVGPKPGSKPAAGKWSGTPPEVSDVVWNPAKGIYEVVEAGTTNAPRAALPAPAGKGGSPGTSTTIKPGANNANVAPLQLEYTPAARIAAPDYYVNSSGIALPATGYRYMDSGSKYAAQTIATMSAPLSYFGSVKLDSGAAVRDAFQIFYEPGNPASWSDGRLLGTFDTLQLFGPNGVVNARVPMSLGDKGPSLEPFTSAYPQYGAGGAAQLLPAARGTVVKFDSIVVLPETAPMLNGVNGPTRLPDILSLPVPVPVSTVKAQVSAPASLKNPSGSPDQAGNAARIQPYGSSNDADVIGFGASDAARKDGGANNVSLPGGSEFIGPLTEIDSKILFGASKPGTNKIIGGHSPEVLTSPLYEMNPKQVVNPDGTISLTDFKGTILRKDGTVGLSKAKSPNIQTVAPPSWDNVDILLAGQFTANTPGVVLRNINGVETTLHTSVYNGVQWQVLKENGVVTSSFPTGGRPIVPEGK